MEKYKVVINPTTGQLQRVHTDEYIASLSSPGSGDMQKSIYDADEDGIVDKAQTIDDGTSGEVNKSTAQEVREAVNKTHDAQTADTLPTEDSGVSVQDVINTLEENSHPQNTDTILKKVPAGLQTNVEQSEYDGSYNFYQNGYAMYQSFIPTESGELQAVTFKISRNNNPEDLHVEIRDMVSAGEVASIVLTSEVIASSEISEVSLSDLTVTFSVPISLLAGSRYALLLWSENVDSSNRYHTTYPESPNPYTDGEFISGELDSAGEFSEPSSYDGSFYFKIWLYLASSITLIDHGTLKQDLTVDDGKLVDGRDVSVDGQKLDTVDPHTHSNKAELDLVSNGDHDVASGNPHGTVADDIEYETVVPFSWTKNGADFVSRPAGAVVDGTCYLIYQDSDIYDYITLPVGEATYTFEPNLHGNYIAGVWSRYQIKLDDAVIYEGDASFATYWDFPVDLSVVGTGSPQKIAIAFINNYYVEPDDRNLWVGSLTVSLPAVVVTVKDELDTLGDDSHSEDVHTLVAVPEDCAVSGITIPLTAGAEMVFGDIGYIASTGKVLPVDASSIGTSSGIVMCADTSITAEATGNFLLLGIARNDAWTWNVGGLVYIAVSVTAGLTLSQAKPTETDEVVQVVGVATHANRIYFNPNLVQVELT